MSVTTELETQERQTILCVICLDHVLLHQVTAGSLRKDGSQAFACSSHLFDRRSWIASWVLIDCYEETTASANERSFAL